MLMRFDPFREFDRLSQEVLNSTARRQNAMPMDAFRLGDTFKIRFDLPGVDPSSIDLTVEKNVLTVRAERGWDLGDGVEVLVTERQQGTYSRQLFLGDTLDTGNITADYDQGVLTVSIPVAEVAKPRRVQVTSTGQGATEIEGASAGASASNSA